MALKPLTVCHLKNSAVLSRWIFFLSGTGYLDETTNVSLLGKINFYQIPYMPFVLEHFTHFY